MRIQRLLSKGELAGAEQDADRCIEILHRVQKGEKRLWCAEDTALFSGLGRKADFTGMTAALLLEIGRAPAFAFLRQNAAFQALAAEYGLLDEMS